MFKVSIVGEISLASGFYHADLTLYCLSSDSNKQVIVALSLFVAIVSAGSYTAPVQGYGHTVVHHEPVHVGGYGHGHGHAQSHSQVHHGSYVAPVHTSYVAPAHTSYVAPAHTSYVAPAHTSYVAPAPVSHYGSEQLTFYFF